MRPPIAFSYSRAQKFVHWSILILCIAQFPTAAAIQRTHAAGPFGLKPDPIDLILHQVHAWNGWMILLLAAILLGLRLVRGAPVLPTAMAAWQRWTAHASRVCLYLGILALAATGTGTMYLSQDFAPVHVFLTKLGIGLVALHAAAALWHQFMLRDNLLWRMMPNSRGNT